MHNKRTRKILNQNDQFLATTLINDRIFILKWSKLQSSTENINAMQPCVLWFVKTMRVSQTKRQCSFKPNNFDIMFDFISLSQSPMCSSVLKTRASVLILVRFNGIACLRLLIAPISCIFWGTMYQKCNSECLSFVLQYFR